MDLGHSSFRTFHHTGRVAVPARRCTILCPETNGQPARTSGEVSCLLYSPFRKGEVTATNDHASYVRGHPTLRYPIPEPGRRRAFSGGARADAVFAGHRNLPGPAR